MTRSNFHIWPSSSDQTLPISSKLAVHYDNKRYYFFDEQPALSSIQLPKSAPLVYISPWANRFRCWLQSYNPASSTTTIFFSVPVERLNSDNTALEGTKESRPRGAAPSTEVPSKGLLSGERLRPDMGHANSTLPAGTPLVLRSLREKNCIIGIISSRSLGMWSPGRR